MTIAPSDINIRNLQPGEEVKLVLQRHWIALVFIFWYFFFLLISLIFMIYFGNRIPLIWDYINVVLVIYTSVFLLFIYINWMRYELDLYIVTSKRIIWLEEVSFLNRHLSECSLDKVQEVNAKTTGLLSNLLNYWEVTIHTASEASDFNMPFMPDAFENARNISNIINDHKIVNRWA
jgi:membrane protein YdbS with pleckstrin-like domain